MSKISKTKIIKNAMNYINGILVSLENHYYHHYWHSVEVMNRAIYLWEKEWLKNEDLEILALAWLFHDTWYIIEYDENERFWAKIAKNYLKSILYPDEKIKIIEDLIMATSISYTNPKNILEKIIKDSDMDNLWTDNFFEKWNNLKREIEQIKNIKINEPDWQHNSLNLLKNHSFYTRTENIEREEKKLENEKELEKIVSEKK